MQTLSPDATVRLITRGKSKNVCLFAAAAVNFCERVYRPSLQVGEEDGLKRVGIVVACTCFASASY